MHPSRSPSSKAGCRLASQSAVPEPAVLRTLANFSRAPEVHSLHRAASGGSCRSQRRCIRERRPLRAPAPARERAASAPEAVCAPAGARSVGSAPPAAPGLGGGMRRGVSALAALLALAAPDAAGSPRPAQALAAPTWTPTPRRRRTASSSPRTAGTTPTCEGRRAANVCLGLGSSVSAHTTPPVRTVLTLAFIYLSCFLLPALLFSSRISAKNRWRRAVSLETIARCRSQPPPP